MVHGGAAEGSPIVGVLKGHKVGGKAWRSVCRNIIGKSPRQDLTEQVAGPNVATGPVGYEMLFTPFGNSPHVGLQYDMSHLVRQFMDELQTARDFADKFYDVHLKDTEILRPVLRRAGIDPVTERSGGDIGCRALDPSIGQHSSRFLWM